MDLKGLENALSPLETSGEWAALCRQAERLLARAASGSPQEAYLRYLLGKARLERGHRHLAEPHLRRSLQLQPLFPFSHHLLGRCHAEAGRWWAAHRSQRRCCELEPGFAYAWFQRGRTALALGATQDALSCFQRAASLAPELHWLQHEILRTEVRLALEEQAPERAAERISSALGSLRLPEPLLVEWLNLAYGYALCGFFGEARLLSKALAADTALHAGSGDSLPTRPAVLLQGILLLLRSARSPIDHDAREAELLAGPLRERHWMAVRRGETDLWPIGIAPLLEMLMARLSRGRQGEGPGVSSLATGIFTVAMRLAAALPAPADGVLPSSEETASGRLRRRLAAALGLTLPSEEGIGDAEQDSGEADLRGTLEALPDSLRRAAVEMAERPGCHRALERLDGRLLRFSRLTLDRTARLAEAEGTVERARELRQECLDLLAKASGALAELDGARPLPPVERGRRWLLVVSGDLPQCFLYRVQSKIDVLQRAGCHVRVIQETDLQGWGWTAELLGADALLICRLPATYPLLRLIARARRAGMAILYDIDDLIFDQRNFPPPLAHYGGTIDPQIHRGLALDGPLFQLAMEQADTVLVSTRTLARRWVELSRRSGQKVLVLPNMAPAALERLARTPSDRTADSPTIVFSSGTLAHKQVWFEEVVPALIRLLGTHPQLRLSLLGSIEVPDDLLVFGDRIRPVSFSSYDDYLGELARCDVGLAPLEPGIVTDAKSAIKWMEYSFLGLASVVSPTATYREILGDGTNVLFARGSAQWETALESLIDQPDRRHRIARRAHERARRLFGSETESLWWRSFLDASFRGASSGEAPSASGKGSRRRLLVINVFFSPQSIGGATRVAEAQVEEVLSAAGDRYEVTVLCAEHDPWQGDEEGSSIPIDLHRWKGARVVRLGLPPTDWSRHYSHRVETFCRQWFREEKFSLIHAHCLQVITAAPLKVARELGIPYLVSLHDAWWLSPLQFLVRDDGHPVNPADPLGHLTPEERDRDDGRPAARARERHAELLAILGAAQGRLAVSEPFADLYRTAGVPDVEVLENPWCPMAREERLRAGSDGPLRICHLGGMALHKGYGVLRAAVLSVELSAVELTVIDHGLGLEEGYRSIWNGTPVRFRPRVAMDEMAGFYASQDVLVAPSIWPESYGLVTREALSAGLWVVASEIGALAEPIREGVNGNRVPPGDWRILGETLRALAVNRPSLPVPAAAGPRPVRGGGLVRIYDDAPAARGDCGAAGS